MTHLHISRKILGLMTLAPKHIKSTILLMILHLATILSVQTGKNITARMIFSVQVEVQTK